jgi:hypothetical protein
MLGIERESERMFRSKPAKEPERFYLLPGQGGRAARRKQIYFLKWSIIAGLGIVGDIGGVDVFIESFWLLSGALDPPGFVVSMRADFDEVFPFHCNSGGGCLFQPAVARGIG